MKKVEEITNHDTLEWLLETDNPSIRYFTLTKLLNKFEGDSEVIDAKSNIMNTGVVSLILGQQNCNGYWGDPQRFYTDKYSGSVWQLLILAELGATIDNPQIAKACEFILDSSQDRESHGFSMNKSGKSGGGRHSEVIPCLTGNLVYSFIKLGLMEDVRVQKGIEWICKYQRCDDGILDGPTEWPYDRYETCWGKHSCHMGIVKSLKALSVIPREKKNDRIEEKTNDLAEYLLGHHIHKKSHDLDKVSKPGWLKLGFPLMYQTDILEIIGILTDLGYKDPRMGEAIDIIRNKQNRDGRWVLENTFNSKMIEDIEVKGLNSKWITLKALCILMKVS